MHVRIIGAKTFVRVWDAKKLESKFREAMTCGLSEKKRISTEFETRRLAR